MKMLKRTILQLQAILLLFGMSLAGCSGGAGGVPVEGQVTLDGKPFENVQVLFYVPGGGPETNFTAISDKDGFFALTSLDGERAGVPPGSYAVTLTTAHWPLDAIETTPPPIELVPRSQREHKFEVPAEGTEAANFELASK